MQENERFIPDNYNYLGIKIRNIIETLIVDIIGIFIISRLNLSQMNSIYAGAFLLPVTILGYIGINNMSVTEYLISWVMFMKNRRVLEEPTAEYLREKDKKALKKKFKEGI